MVHVLVDFPNLTDPRQELRNKIGDTFNDITCMLEGREVNR